MKIKAKNNETEYVLLGIKPEKYLVYPDVSGMVAWYDKTGFQALDAEPAYLVEDSNCPNQKVVEIFKREYDLDFYTGQLSWGETLTPHYFRVKRIKLALSSIGLSDFFSQKQNAYNDEFCFAMLVGKFETINEIIDAHLQEKEEHSRFEWNKWLGEIKPEKELLNKDLEQGIIDLCRFISPKVIKNKYSDFLFTDIYGIWKTFLLGDEFMKFGEIDIVDCFEPKFVCTFKKGKENYQFNYQYYQC